MSSTERTRNWRIKHPIRWKRMRTKYFQKIRAPCRRCGEKMIFPTAPGKQYCDYCLPLHKREEGRKYSAIVFQKFMFWKERKGCSRCGYNRYGGSIDFHHKGSEIKEKRITAFEWLRRRKSGEIKKCILLCKNCHYEVHHEQKKQLTNDPSREVYGEII